MARKSTQRMAAVVFKIEEELASVLNSLPNKSAFIRKAIAFQLGVCCPLCQGKGHVSRGICDHYGPLILANRHRPCEGCGKQLPLPDPLCERSAKDQSRLEQFFRGGPLYCRACYRSSSKCDECGWQIGSEWFDDHVRFAHPKADSQPMESSVTV
jgi:hypothetical protein